jgi:hypothetical protein
MKQKHTRVLISLIAAIGLFFLSGCGGGKVGESEISKVMDGFLKDVNTAFAADPILCSITIGPKKDVLSMVGFPIDVENDDVVLDSWRVSILAQGKPILNTVEMKVSGMKASVQSSVSGSRASGSAQIEANEIPLETKLYPVIYQLISKDKKHEGRPQERYFYKDTYGKWAAAKPEDVGMEHSAGYRKFVMEYSQQLLQKIKAEKESPRGVLKACLKHLIDGNIDEGHSNALAYVSRDYRDIFIKTCLGGITEPLTLLKSKSSGAEEYALRIKGKRNKQLKEALRDIKVVKQKISNESAKVTVSGDKVFSLKKAEGKWLITGAPRIFEEGTFNKDEGIPDYLVSEFFEELCEFSRERNYSGLRSGHEKETDEVLADIISKYAVGEFRDLIINKLLSEARDIPRDKLARKPWENEIPESDKKYLQEEKIRQAVRNYLDTLIDNRKEQQIGESKEDINNESAKVVLLKKNKVVSLLKVDGKWFITGIQ